MNIYVYSDESGVFDCKHNDYYVFGGLILLGNEEKEIQSRKYANVESTIRKTNHFNKSFEIKACNVSNKVKEKIFRSLNGCYKFACIIDEQKVIKNIWNSKKDKQRYLDYAYKISVKRAFQKIIDEHSLRPDTVENIHFFIDEHTTATNGRYELKQSLEQEFKFGTYNATYSKFFEPIFKSLQSVSVDFCNSSAPSKRLIRVADFIANKVYHLTVSEQWNKLDSISNINITCLP